MRNLYPKGKLIHSGQLKIDENTSIYYEERGNPNGPAIVYNHGGPGGSSHPSSSQWFDPSYYRIILYDQRGTGKSIPSIRNIATPSHYFKNLTIDDMVSDLETLRQHLNIKRWVVFGGSWGSTLSLYYSEKHPERINGLIIYGIFLNTIAEMNDYYNKTRIKERFGKLGEEAIKILLRYAASQGYTIDPDNAESFVQAYYHLCVLKDDPIAQYLWTAYEDFNDAPTMGSLIKLYQHPTKESLDPIYRSIAVFETSFFREAFRGFNLLNESDLTKLKHLNIRIIQGLDDTEAPPTYAKKLVKQLLKIKPDLHYEFISGRHDGNSSEAMRNALIESTDALKTSRFANVFKNQLLFFAKNPVTSLRHLCEQTHELANKFR